MAKRNSKKTKKKPAKRTAKKKANTKPSNKSKKKAAKKPPRKPGDIPAPEPTGQRDARGQFVKGNIIARRGGRPSDFENRRRLAVMSEMLSDDDLRAIMLGIIHDARAGSPKAWSFLAKHFLPQKQYDGEWIFEKQAGGIVAKKWSGPGPAPEQEQLPPAQPNETVEQTFQRLFPGQPFPKTVSGAANRKDDKP